MRHASASDPSWSIVVYNVINGFRSLAVHDTVFRSNPILLHSKNRISPHSLKTMYSRMLFAPLRQTSDF